MKTLTVFIILLLSSFNTFASDSAKEQRWAEQIVDSIMTGDAEWLPITKGQILSIYTEAEQESVKDFAIIVHGSGVHPNWPDVIYPLRTRLIDHGWHTLSIQMPVLANDAQHDEYAPLFYGVADRLNAAIAFLKQQGAQRIIIVAHSLGASMSSYYLANESNHPIEAFVGIGMSAPANDAKMDNAVSLAKIQLPVLDLYGSEDLESVLTSAKLRQQAARKAANINYQQKVIAEASHFFNGKDDALLDAVVQWLERTFP